MNGLAPYPSRNSIRQERAPFGKADRRFATVTEGASGLAEGELDGTVNGDGPDCLE